MTSFPIFLFNNFSLSWLSFIFFTFSISSLYMFTCFSTFSFFLPGPLLFFIFFVSFVSFFWDILRFFPLPLMILSPSDFTPCLPLFLKLDFNVSPPKTSVIRPFPNSFATGSTYFDKNGSARRPRLDIILNIPRPPHFFF